MFCDSFTAFAENNGHWRRAAYTGAGYTDAEYITGGCRQQILIRLRVFFVTLDSSKLQIIDLGCIFGS